MTNIAHKTYTTKLVQIIYEKEKQTETLKSTLKNSNPVKPFPTIGYPSILKSKSSYSLRHPSLPQFIDSR